MKKQLERHDVDGVLLAETVPSDHIDNYVLVANTPKTVTIPQGARRVAFSSTGDFYARWNGAPAAVPGADVVNGAGVEINPTTRSLGGLASFSIVAPAPCVVALAFYG